MRGAVLDRAESGVRPVTTGSGRGRCPRRLFATLAVSVISVVLLGGCGGTSAAQTARGRAALLSTLENWTALQTPVDQALGILTEKCMAEHGLRYYPFAQTGQPGGSPIFASQLFGSSLWIGPQSLAWRIVNGWGLYEETMQQLSQPGGFFGGGPAEFRFMRAMRGQAIQTYMRTLWGGGKTMKIHIPGLPRTTIRIGGCNTTAGRQLFGTVAASVAVPQYGPAILNGTIQPRAARSGAVRSSEATWSACVHAGTGIAARSPSQLFLHIYSLYQTKGPTPAVHHQELRAALTDLRCQRRSGLSQAVQAAALAAVGRLPGPVLGELQTLLGVLDQARMRARAVFAHPPPSGVPSENGSNQVPEVLSPAVGYPGGPGGPVVAFSG